ncbi:chorismate mutase [Actinomycetospora endophytica]|uniref:chorismate mutase n=1 Tax=Actinomycetospora endophytica TaxID=2291215 RepID=UPI0027E26685|nr:chorismate mutase [Actinomycetospora endophytica]
MTDSPTSTDTTTDPAAPESAPGPGGAPADLTPATADEIPNLRVEIDAIDAEILRLVKRRTEISQRVGLARMNAGGPRIVYNREMQVLARFRDLGAEGRELAMLLLRLGRGKLGSR